MTMTDEAWVGYGYWPAKKKNRWLPLLLYNFINNLLEYTALSLTHDFSVFWMLKKTVICWTYSQWPAWP